MNLVYADGRLIEAESWTKSRMPDSPAGFVELPVQFQPDKLVLILVSFDWVGKFWWSHALNRPPKPSRHDPKYVVYELDFLST